MSKGYPGEGWGKTWTDNKMFHMKDETERQKAVVKKFLSDHPEYFQCDWNDKAIVDSIELSKRPFTTETIEWAYETVKDVLNKKTGFFEKKTKESYKESYNEAIKKISSGLNNKDSQQQDSNLYQLQQLQQVANQQSFFNDLLKLGASSQQWIGTDTVVKSKVEETTAPKSDGIVPLETTRRIKDND